MERPIIFNDAMSLAVIRDLKTETRRPLAAKHQGHTGGFVLDYVDGIAELVADGDSKRIRLPAVPGDKLWVREAWRVDELSAFREFRCDDKCKVIYYGKPSYQYGDRTPEEFKAFALEVQRWSAKLRGGKWAPSIHMPRWAARTVLDVLEVRVERLQDMTEEDARAEGFETRAAFCGTWDVIYPTMGMRHNPLVWVVRFKRQGGA